MTNGYEPRYARITRAGFSPLRTLPADADNMRFDPAGTKLFYTLKSATNGDRVFVRSLADDSTQELVVAT